MSFDALGLSEPILRAVVAQGYSTPTPIQVQAIPHVLTGRDLFGCAQTGTGKTAAFALPILDRFHRAGYGKKPDPAAAPARSIAAHGGPANRRSEPGRRPETPRHAGVVQRRPVRALILAPTRELAAQIDESFREYGQFSGLRSAVIFGGVGQNPQVRALRAGVEILVATPGRLLDLMQQGHVDLGSVEVLILDEADQMLDMGFLPALQRIVAAVPRHRQTLLFSATMPPEIRRLADNWLNDPLEVKVAPAGTPAAAVEQYAYMVDTKDKPQMLVHYLSETPVQRALVFTRTKHGADKVVRKLEQSGIRAAAIHGNKSQNQRQRALDQFKSNAPPVLVATDIASRGLDISGVSHVINYDVPNVPEVYVHRIGRTARAGATGVAVSLCSKDERASLRHIERLIRLTIAVRPHDLPGVPASSMPSEPEGGGRRPSRPEHAAPRPSGPRQGSSRFGKSNGRPSGGSSSGSSARPGAPRPRRATGAPTRRW